MNSVSAGHGPEIGILFDFASLMAGSITSLSSEPRRPDSPEWGLRPATQKFFIFMLFLVDHSFTILIVSVILTTFT